MAGFGVAIAWHQHGLAVRRAAWPPGRHVRPDLQLREPVTNFLAVVREWDPNTDDIVASDWEVSDE